MNLSIDHSGFHGHNSVVVRIPWIPKPGEAVEVSRRVARRVNAACCGLTSCECGEHIASATAGDRYEIEIPPDWEPGDRIEMRGRYGRAR